MVQPKKNSDDIRICVDMRQANKAIRRTRHLIPTLEELRHQMNGANKFSKLDLKNGFHQLELHPSSRYITTFSTHVGLRRNTRLNLGTNSASEIFHESLRKILAGIPGVFNIHDDIFVFGRDEEHDVALERVLQRLMENNITLNLSKCVLGTNVIDFFGVRFSEHGMSPDVKKVCMRRHR